MTSPVSSICSARLRPIARLTATMGVEQNSPIRTPGVPKTAVDAATARSQVATSWHPAATAVPCTAAITGWGTSWTAVIISVQTANTSRSSSRVRPTISRRSWPAEKAGPAARTTIAPTSGVAASSRSSAVKTVIVATDSGLRCAGRSSVSTPTRRAPPR